MGEEVLRTQIITMDGKYGWRAKGKRLVEFCHMFDPPPIIQSDGWLYQGPFEDEEAAKRDLERFQRAYLEQHGNETITQMH
jgi:hypothetical protein